MQHSDAVIMHVYPGLSERGKTTVSVQSIADEVNVDVSNTEGWQIIFNKKPSKVIVVMCLILAIIYCYNIIYAFWLFDSGLPKRHSSSRSTEYISERSSRQPS